MTLTTSATTTEQQHEQTQNQEPAQASSNARGEKEKIDIYTEVTNQLLELMETAQTSGQSMWANVLAGLPHNLAHEMTHWTGHKSRLDRFKSQRHENAEYAFEELIAELGSAFLMAQTGGAQASLDNHACYLQSWIKALQNDNKSELLLTVGKTIAMEKILIFVFITIVLMLSAKNKSI
jgi:Zincin-like metallopeptidase